MEVYVDESLVKARSQSSLLLICERSTFRVLWKYKMNLNPIKCAFGVESKNFLGFTVLERKFEVNLEKIRSPSSWSPPKSTMRFRCLQEESQCLVDSFSSQWTSAYHFFDCCASCTTRTKISMNWSLDSRNTSPILPFWANWTSTSTYTYLSQQRPFLWN